MDRRHEVTKFITREQVGVEIAPYFAGLAPKRDGYRCLVLDVFDTERLLRNAAGDPHVPKESLGLIEPVDLVGSATSIATLVKSRRQLGSLDYVLSSHNFEHLPDALGFLKGCEQVLKPGGIVSMAIPDRRVCFDHFRPESTTADVIEAFQEQRTRPTLKQCFLAESLRATFVDPQGKPQPGFGLSSDVARVIPDETVAASWQTWQRRLQTQDEAYVDIHCWTFTPSSLELILRDLIYLGLLRLEIVEISDTHWHEFFVHLRNPSGEAKPPPPRAEFHARRAELLRQVNRQAGSASFLGKESAQSQLAAAERITALEAELTRISEQRDLSQAQVETLEAELAGLRHSKSWRVTRPLRIASVLVKQLNRRLGS